jgi:hypothetical protein
VEVFTANPVPSPTHFWSDRPGALYRANTNSWLAYNANINLSGYGSQEIFLGMGTAFNLEYGYDIGYIEISNNGGASWATLATLTGGSHWYSYSWRIPPAYKTNQFRMRFRLQSDSTVQYDGWLIDNVGIKVAPALTFAYESWDGTSMACPHVAGAVGLLASQFGTETVAQRKARILNWGDYNASLDGRTVTCKRLNIYRSLYNPSITVTSPNGGESWMVSSTHNITWTWLGAVNNVNIDYSLDGGTNWTSIASNQPNTGTYSWTIPAVATPQNNCRIRVQEYGCTTSVTDQSDAVFSIIAFSSETVSTPTTPTGPTTGTVGTAYTYSTGGSISNWGDPVQYFFDWDDGSDSGWLAVGTTSAWHSWGVAGTYNVRVMARCGTHTGIVSGWSDPPLAVNQNSHPTWVAVSRFEACVTESQPTVEWHTACEVSPVGFNLWRLDKTTHEYLLVNASFLPALPSSPQGGAYRFADPGASYGEPEIYRLEEVDSQGRVMSYGPFTVTFGGYAAPAPDDPAARMGKEDATDIQGYRRCEREHSPYERERLQARSLDRQKGMALAAAQGREQVRITVKGRGLFYVTSAQVARSLGIPTAQAEALIGKHGLNMTNKGNRVAWLADRNGAGVFFYNDGSVTPYSEQNVYWLERGSGLAMETVNAGNAGPADAGQTYRESLHFEEDHYAMTGVFSSPTADIWLWDYVIAGGAARSFAIEVPGVAAGGMAKLTVTLQGETSTAADNDHHAVVALNGREIGGATWDGSKAHTFEIAFSSTLLSAGANTLSVSGLLDTGAPYSTFYVESFDLEYHRYYQAVNNTLQCRGDGNPVITVGGFTELDVLALDVSRPRLPKLLAGVVPDVSGRVTFIPRAADNDYMLCGLNAAQRPLAVTGDRPATIKGLGNSAEYLVIAPEELEETAQELADYRKGQGLKSLVVSVEDIYEAFNHGIPSPLAIRDFLAYAYNKWTGKKVKYAVLAGKGTYDYNDRLGKGDNLVPVILAKTPDGLFAADKEFGDVKGKDGLPEIAIGRLPVVTNAELRDVIEKIKAYDGSQGGWTGKALMIADNNDGGGDFAQGSDELAGLADGYPAEKIYLSGSPAETRSRILAAWSAGAGLVNYCGHAGLDRLAQENIFDVTTAIGLRNNGRLPLAVMLTCVAGRFELPGFTSLGEALLLNREGGIAGGMFPSGAGMHADSMRLGTEFYKAALRGQGMTAGQALLAAMKSYLLLGGSPYLLNIYNWIGDPALAYR